MRREQPTHHRAVNEKLVDISVEIMENGEQWRRKELGPVRSI